MFDLSQYNIDGGYDVYIKEPRVYKISFDNIKIKEYASGNSMIYLKNWCEERKFLMVELKTGYGGIAVFRLFDYMSAAVEVNIGTGGITIDNISFYLEYDPNNKTQFGVYGYLNGVDQGKFTKIDIALAQYALSPMAYIYRFSMGDMIESVGNITSYQVENVGD